VQLTRLLLFFISSCLFLFAPSPSLASTDDYSPVAPVASQYTPIQYVTPELIAIHDSEQTTIEWIKALAIWIPASVVIYTFWALRKTIEAQGITKAVELALTTSSLEEASYRARFIYRLMNKNLPADFDATLERLSRKRPKIDAPPPHIIEARATLIRTLAEFPAQREQILNDWSRCFGPIETWPARITKTVALHSSRTQEIFWPES
jgi:hypothetical protein